MPVAIAELVSVVLYLVPVLVFVSARSRRERAVALVALDVPFAVALDLLSTMLLARFTTLENATLLSRGLWIAGGVIVALRRRSRIGHAFEWPRSLGRHELGSAGLAAILAVYSCSFISRKFVVWDSQWHTSIVTSIAVQRIPFVNPLSPSDILHYHFAGDVLAAMQRILSFDVLSANAALHQSHDLLFALIAIVVALQVAARAKSGATLVALTAVAVLLNGPMPFRGSIGYAFLGYEYHSFITLSYRPHVPLSALLVVAILSAVVVRLEASVQPSLAETGPGVLAAVALLAVTDETSTALVCASLGLTWLFFPDVVAPKRPRGFLLLVACAASIAVTNLGFSASLAPGGPVQKIAFSPTWRIGSLGIEYPSIPFTDPRAFTIMAIELAPLVVPWLALVALAIRSHRGRRVAVALAVFAATLLCIAVPLALRVDINGDSTEVHRFFVAPFFAVCTFAVLELHAMKVGSIEVVLVLVGLGIPAVSSVIWMREVAPSFMASRKVDVNPRRDVFVSDCRAIAAAHLGDHNRSLYVEPSELTRFVGCRPVFSPAKTEASWATKITPLTDSLAQLRALDGAVPHEAELEAICKSTPAGDDVVCRAAKAVRSSCRPEGSDYLSCPLTPQMRDALLRRTR